MLSVGGRRGVFTADSQHVSTLMSNTVIVVRSEEVKSSCSHTADTDWSSQRHKLQHRVVISGKYIYFTALLHYTYSYWLLYRVRFYKQTYDEFIEYDVVTDYE